MAGNNKSVAVGTKKGNVIETGTMTIKGHLLRLPNIVIQISNISGIAATEVHLLNPGSFLTLIGICMVVAGGILVKMSSRYDYWSGTYYDEGTRTVAIIMLAIGVVLMFVGYAINENAKRTCLNIYLNGGVTHSIIFSSREFMNEVLDRLAEIFENGGIVNQEININIKDCKFIGSSVINPGTIMN